MSRRKLSSFANPGKRNCLKCDKEFDSEDMINNRLCPKCNRDNKNVFKPSTTASTVHLGGSAHHFDSED